jgi:hypothetical protein
VEFVGGGADGADGGSFDLRLVPSENGVELAEVDGQHEEI